MFPIPQCRLSLKTTKTLTMFFKMKDYKVFHQILISCYSTSPFNGRCLLLFFSSDDTNDQYNWGCKVDTRNNPANELPYFRGPHTNSGLVFNNSKWLVKSLSILGSILVYFTDGVLDHWIVCNRPVSVKTDGQKYQLWEEEEWPMLSVYGSVAECPQFFKFTELPIVSFASVPLQLCGYC